MNVQSERSDVSAISGMSGARARPGRWEDFPDEEPWKLTPEHGKMRRG